MIINESTLDLSIFFDVDEKMLNSFFSFCEDNEEASAILYSAIDESLKTLWRGSLLFNNLKILEIISNNIKNNSFDILLEKFNIQKKKFLNINSSIYSRNLIKKNNENKVDDYFIIFVIDRILYKRNFERGKELTSIESFTSSNTITSIDIQEMYNKIGIGFISYISQFPFSEDELHKLFSDMVLDNEDERIYILLKLIEKFS